MIRLAWRLSRWQIAGFALLSLLVFAVNSGGYTQIAGSTEAQRLAFARSMSALGAQLTYLLPVPAGLETVGGYLEWRAFGGLVIIYAFWGVFAGSGSRGDEERGLVEQWLAASRSRTGILALRFVAFAVAVAASLAATDIVAVATARAGNATLSLRDTALQSFALLTMTLAFYGVGVVCAQLVSRRRNAAGLASVVMVALFFVNSLSRQAEALRPYRAVSPFYLYDRTDAMVTGGHLDVLGTAACLVTAVVLAAVALVLFRSRDLGSGIGRSRAGRARPLNRFSRMLLSTPVLRRNYEQRLGLLAWAAGVFVMALVFAQTAKPAVRAIEALPSMKYLLGAAGDPVVGYLGTIWAGITALLLAAFAITQVAGWSGEDSGGRLESTLSAPISRSRVVFERAATLLLATVLVAGAACVALLVAARAEDLALGLSNVGSALAMAVPFTLAFGAVGAAAAAFRPRAAVGVLAVLAAGSYLVVFLGPLFKVPDWVLNLSVFKLFGNPLANGVYAGGFIALATITLAGFAAAAAAMQRRDVGA